MKPTDSTKRQITPNSNSKEDAVDRSNRNKNRTAMKRSVLRRIVLAIAFMGCCIQLCSAAGNLTDNNLINDLYYDRTDGSVELRVPDLTGTGPIVQFGLGTNGTFDFTSGHVTTGLDCGLILPPVACGTLSEQAISYDDPTNVGFDGAFKLGTILPPGLTGPEVQSFLTEASYRTENISERTDFDIRVVPEPSGILISLFAVATLLAFRRRVDRAT